MNNLQKKYNEEYKEKIKNELGIKNDIAVPRLSKIIVNMGVRDAGDKKVLEQVSSVISQITGQKPKVTTAKKSIAGFKLREGDPVGVMVTLRGKRMYDFFEKVVTVVLPRLRDFRGVRKSSFDGRGNYALGFSEFSVFPEIDSGKIERSHGLEVVISTTADSNEKGMKLLTALGMPFEKDTSHR